MEHPEIALVLSAVCFSLVIGFLAGYGVRAYVSLLRRRVNGRYGSTPSIRDRLSGDSASVGNQQTFGS